MRTSSRRVPRASSSVVSHTPQSEDAHHKYGALSKYLPPVLAQTFVMTFLAEWGDRSQIATISMGADYNALGICVGGSAGHATATAQSHRCSPGKSPPSCDDEPRSRRQP